MLNSDQLDKIRAMCDVTNGGLRGNLYEINHEANCGVLVQEQEVKKLVNPQVLELLESVNVDYLGVSLDALLIYCSEQVSDQIISDLKEVNIKCAEIGIVNDTKHISMDYEDKQKEDILPKFRESAYTRIKQEIGEESPDSIEEMEKKIEIAASEALKKRKKIIEYIRNQIDFNYKQDKHIKYNLILYYN